LKTVKSPHLCNRLTDFDEIWHDDNNTLHNSDNKTASLSIVLTATDQEPQQQQQQRPFNGL